MHLFWRIRRLCRGCSWCVRMCLVTLLFIVWLTLRPQETRSFKGLDVWLDHEQAKKFLGVDAAFYFIQSDRPSAVSSNTQTRHLATRSRLQMSRETRYLNISFCAPAGYYYLIDDVTTSNPHLVGHPVFSIATSGRVPSRTTVFSMELPCSGRESGSALVSFRLHFQTDNYDRKDIKASPLLFQIEKECVKSSQPTVTGCHPPCSEAGGVCTSGGRCDCKDGYYGHRCAQVICNPRCYNGGTCVAPGVCSCVDGFSGKFCHLASCKDNCYNHGRCIAPGQCKCYKNWSGSICQIPVNDRSKARPAPRRIAPDTDDIDSLHDLYEDHIGDGHSNYSSK